MKKKIGIISALLVIVIVIISIILLTNKKRNEPLNFNANGSNIAYMYEDENGGYTQGSSTAWSSGDYVLDIKDSKCNGNTNPEDIIDWNAKSNGVLLKANENVSCTLYFDKITAQEKFFKKLLGPSGEGELLYHNSQLENGANDHGYRYSGNNPNNFICFGPGSESYTGSSGQCPDKNLYRIIGYVPVQLENGEIYFRIKVIKSEYAAASDLGKTKADGTSSFASTYKDLKRVKSDGNIDAFYWHDDEEGSPWGGALLYKALNTNSSNFLKNLNSWESKIETVKWNVAGHNTPQVTAKEIYDIENNDTQGGKIKVPAKIGLMYLSDYGFASSKDNWTTDLYNYDNDQNRKNNWLFNAAFEWTISRSSNGGDSVFRINGSGRVETNAAVYAQVVRPVFYLTSSVTLSNGNGSYETPYKVN